MSTDSAGGADRAVQLVNAALRLIDEDGLDALTMRRLASSLGLQLPAIYRVFHSKQAILDHAAEAVLGRVKLSSELRASWQDETRALAHSLRDAILSQRDGARIVGGRYTAHQNTLALADRLVESMNRAGFTGNRALWATSTLFCYVLGETLEQQGSSTNAVEALEAIDTRHQYPYLFGTPTDQLVNFDERFDFGIDTLVRGLDTEV